MYEKHTHTHSRVFGSLAQKGNYVNEKSMDLKYYSGNEGNFFSKAPKQLRGLGLTFQRDSDTSAAISVGNENGAGHGKGERRQRQRKPGGRAQMSTRDRSCLCLE